MKKKKSYFQEQEERKRKEKKSSRKNSIISILIFILLVSYVVLKRSYHTKILPFQSITLNCVMDRAQLFHPNQRPTKYSPGIVKLPKVFKIKFGYYDGKFIEGGDVLIENHFLKKKGFGYQYTKFDSILIQPTYKPPWMGPEDQQGDLMLFILPLNHLSKKREDIWIDWNWMSGMGVIKDYDAHYNCEDKE